MKDSGRVKGVASAVCAYTLWGILPVYWKLLNVPAGEILAHRIIWSFLFMLLIIFIARRSRLVMEDWYKLTANAKKMAVMVAASLLVSGNWLVYIWAVNDSRIVETSLGYYINPLVSVLLGVIVLKERLSFWQTTACIIAAAGVLNLAINAGTFPWVALLLAITFSLYGLCKKVIGISAITGITIETLFVAPAAIFYLGFLGQQGQGFFTLNDLKTAGLLAGSGVVTAVPLMLFADGANRLPLTLLGLIQYVSPTIALFIGIFAYHEPFTGNHMVSFACIWAGLAIFSLSRNRLFIQSESWVKKKAAKE